MRLVIVHGPNLNLLGEREPEIYGTMTLSELNQVLRDYCKKKKIQVRIFQSNHEGKIIDYLHAQRKWATDMVINPGALTHYSYSLRDAIAAIDLPVIEVHLSDLKKRSRKEKFRGHSVIKPVCLGQISGKGAQSYIIGIEQLIDSSVV